MEDLHFIDDEFAVDESKITFENSEVIEYEISNEISLLYDKYEKKYYIYGIDYDDSFDEFNYELDDDFTGIELDGTFVSKEEFDDFKKLIQSLDLD